MDGFFPFIYRKQIKKEWEPEPLYVELVPPSLIIEEKKEQKDDIDRGITIIEL